MGKKVRPASTADLQCPKASTAFAPAGDDGFMLAVVIFMIFLILLALTAAAPRISMQIKREREVEAAHRANQYVRAIQMYYKKFGHYPGALEQLDKTNNQRFLRQHYLDPLTGKDDWRLIHLGENKTKVKGLFGEDLPGPATGLGAASGLVSPTGGGSTTGSAFNNPGTAGGAASGSGLGATGAAAGGGFGSSQTPATTPNAGGTGATSSGPPSQSATDFKGGGGGYIIGLGSSRTGEAIVVVNEQSHYQDWEFLYDPRIELLKSRASLFGGITSGPPGSGTLGAPPSGFGGPSTPPPPTQPSPTLPPTTPP